MKAVSCAYLSEQDANRRDTPRLGDDHRGLFAENRGALNGNSTLAQWFMGAHPALTAPDKTTMIVALARKPLIALWRLATTGVVPNVVVLRPAA